MTECVSEAYRNLPFQDIQKKMAQSARNKLFILENINELRMQYADKYIAVNDGKILTEGNTPDEVFRNLKKLKISDISTVAIELVPKEFLIWLL